jgi:hypothetical protein
MEVRARNGSETSAVTASGTPTSATLIPWVETRNVAGETAIDPLAAITLNFTAGVMNPTAVASFDVWNAIGATATLGAFSGETNAKAELDLGTLANGDLDTVVEATDTGEEGNDITVAATNTSGSGVVITVTGTAVVIDYEDGVSTVGDVETAIGALSGADDIIGVKTTGTGATVLGSNDTFTATNLAGGTAGITGIIEARVVSE